MPRRLFLVVLAFAVVIQGFIVYFIHGNQDILNSPLYANTVGSYNAMAFVVMMAFAVTSLFLYEARSSLGFAIIALFCIVAGVALGDYRAPWEWALVWIGLPISSVLAIVFAFRKRQLNHLLQIGAN